MNDDKINTPVSTISNLRFSKQILFEPIGLSGQNKLSESSIAIIGCGGLGSVISNNMARAGVGSIRIVDKDILELSNLQRQILYDEQDVLMKTPKATAARDKLLKINSDIKIKAIVDELDEEKSSKYLSDTDLVIDATDNFKTRLIINKFCVNHKIPWIYGAVAGSSGMIFNIIPGRKICFSCIFKEEPPADAVLNCNTIGIINPAVNVVASIQSSEALKILTGNYEVLTDGLISIDLWDLNLEILKINKEKGYKCPVCDNI